MLNATQELHLIVDFLDDALCADADHHTADSHVVERFDTLSIPEGVSYLSLSCRQGKEVFRISREKPEGSVKFLVLGPARKNCKPILALLNSEGVRLRLNGVPSPPLAILNEGDCLQWDHNYTLHLSMYSRPFVGPAPDSMGSKTCPVCRAPIEAGGTVYICPGCGAAMHFEGEEKRGNDRLECGRMVSTCPTCGGDLVFEEGYSYRPELCRA